MNAKDIYTFLIILSSLTLHGYIYGQNEEEDVQSKMLLESNVLEDFLDESEEGEFDNNTIYEHLEYFLSHPIDLNTAKIEDFRSLNFLDELTIIQILEYRDTFGPFFSVSELQAIPKVPIRTARKLAPFVRVSGAADDVYSSIPKMMSSGKNEVFTRWSRTFPNRKGFDISDTTKSRYLGDPNQLYIRYKHSFERNLSYGFTAEKDPGEEFFKNSNEQGFDFYSAHFYLKDYRKGIKAIAIGDYIISLGQGLIQYDGFAAGKSSFTTQVKRSGRRLRAFTSVNEAQFLRGAAAELKLFEKVNVLAFGSIRNIDANVVSIQDTSDTDIDQSQFSSFQLSGLHRTPSEIADKGSTERRTLGLSTGLSGRKGSINFNVVHNQLDRDALTSGQLYQQFNFKGDRLTNYGLDYSYIWRNIHFFGETSLSSTSHAIASINGINITPDRNFDIALVHRYLPRDHHSFTANAVFSETRSAQNEQGLYIGLEYRLSSRFWINMYFDQWKHEWLRFGVDAPSRGNEQFIRLTYYKKRNYTIYVQARNERKQKNLPTALEKDPYDVIEWQTRSQLRLHFSHKLNKSLELRNRAEISYYDIGGRGISRGYLVYQDVIFKPNEFPLSFTTRFALFDTDDYQSRIYAFENDVLYYFSIPPYYNKGSRFYLNLRYRPIKAVTMEFRYARTQYRNVESISTGLNEIAGNIRHDLRAQLKFQF